MFTNTGRQERAWGQRTYRNPRESTPDGFGDKCENEGESFFSDDALFLTWINGEGLIKMTNLVLNKLS